MPDHVHLLVDLSANITVAKLVRVVKTKSSKWVNAQWPDRGKFGWQEGYGAFSVSLSAMRDVELYIANQEEHHRKVTFQEEYLALLRKHDIAYDERFVLG